MCTVNRKTSSHASKKVIKLQPPSFCIPNVAFSIFLKYPIGKGYNAVDNLILLTSQRFRRFAVYRKRQSKGLY